MAFPAAKRANYKRHVENGSQDSLPIVYNLVLRQGDGAQGDWQHDRTTRRGLCPGGKVLPGTEALQELVQELLSGMYNTHCMCMLTGDRYKREELLFAIDLAQKDAGHAKAMASAAWHAHLASFKEH
ncbi:hypothetical protein NQ176_g9149 [Zarea fungicola]|uniref:Uncharacterized protein n=1 Tax=Zarea fungicola TaxID=93591 RepID=A0ACC1MNV4_9HYPO|nr:hypothetical protein NQ176_g9149 [Lecanicillium fungicola]